MEVEKAILENAKRDDRKAFNKTMMSMQTTNDADTVPSSKQQPARARASSVMGTIQPTAMNVLEFDGPTAK